MNASHPTMVMYGISTHSNQLHFAIFAHMKPHIKNLKQDSNKFIQIESMTTLNTI